MTQQYDVLVVGAGHAGAQVCVLLRQFGFEGSIGLVGDEHELPYERPPLSKDYLAGDKAFERLLIRPAAFWQERHVDLLQGRRVVTVNARASWVSLSDGHTIGYRKLVWAAGGTARRLACEGSGLRAVHCVRTRTDVDRIIDSLPTADRVVVIGGGYIGLETAAVLTKLGKTVTVVEAMDRVLARVAGEPLSRFYEAEHRSHGVDVRLNAAVAGIEGEAGRLTGVRLADAEFLPADMVIVGIGIVPSVELLAAAGAECKNGVAVDHRCRTSLPDVFAIGDCALHANDFADGASIRLESVQNANDMASVVAKAITGDEGSYRAVPWFWSNQYDLRLQTVGLSSGYDEAVVRGDPARRSFSVGYLKQGRVVAFDCVNMARDYVQARLLVASRVTASPEQIADTDVSLKSLLPNSSISAQGGAAL